LLNKIVSFEDAGRCGQFGKVVAVKQSWRPTPSGYGPRMFEPRVPGKVYEIDQNFYRVHLINLKTGRLMDCPRDKPHTNLYSCPICGVNVRAEEIRELSRRDLDYYVASGMIGADLVEGGGR
jgi:hypothetical protein